MSHESTWKTLEKWLGHWTTEMTHPALPGVVVHGAASLEWLEGKRFLIQRARTDHADFPDSIAIIGFTGADRVDGGSRKLQADQTELTMHYFDSRGVFRVYDARVEQEAIHFSRSSPGLSQRFTGTFPDGGDTLHGIWQMQQDDQSWADDLKIIYKRCA
jgi:hypothetical protein